MERETGVGSSPGRNQTTVERKSDRELVVTRVFSAPPRVVFEAWTKPDLFMRWWTPKSSGMTLVSCELDVRVGGGYRLEFGRSGSDRTMAFFGTYLDVVPASRLVWTNEEGPDGAVTTVTFTAHGDGTRMVLSEVYPTKEALDASFEGMEGGMPEQLAQLDELLAEGI